MQLLLLLDTPRSLDVIPNSRVERGGESVVGAANHGIMNPQHRHLRIEAEPLLLAYEAVAAVDCMHRWCQQVAECRHLKIDSR